MNYTTADYLESLQEDLEAIKTNLSNGGMEIDQDDDFSNLATKTDGIVIGGGTDIYDYFKNSLYNNVYTENSPGYITLIKKIPAFSFSYKRMDYLFSHFSGEDIDLSLISSSSATNMQGMFYDCANLTSINVSNLNTSNVTNMYRMFSTSFLGNKKNTLNISNFDMGKVTNIAEMFDNCSDLVNLSFGYDLGKGYTETTQYYANYSLTLTSCTNLTHDSLMSVINNLYDLNLTYNVAGGGTLYKQKLNLGSTNLAKLTSAEIQIATDKGWDVS